MNKAKKILIILSIIFSVFDIGWAIYDIVKWFLSPDKKAIFYVIYYFALVVVNIAIVVMLILAIWKNGALFRSRYGLYMTALMLSLIFNLLSISTILLVSTMFISDWVWVKPKDEGRYHKEEKVIIGNKEEHIARLRDMKEKGEITEEQFQEELMKLL